MENDTLSFPVTISIGGNSCTLINKSLLISFWLSWFVKNGSDTCSSTVYSVSLAFGIINKLDSRSWKVLNEISAVERLHTILYSNLSKYG